MIRNSVFGIVLMSELTYVPHSRALRDSSADSLLFYDQECMKTGDRVESHSNSQGRHGRRVIERT